jgi:hypothetical protein
MIFVEDAGQRRQSHTGFGLRFISGELASSIMSNKSRYAFLKVNLHLQRILDEILS